MFFTATVRRSKFAPLWTIAGISGAIVLLHHFAPMGLNRGPLNLGVPVTYLLDLCRLGCVYGLAVVLAFLRPATIGLVRPAGIAFPAEAPALAEVTVATVFFRRRSPYSRTAWAQ